MENNPEEPTVAPVKDDCVKDDFVKENPVHEESAPSSLAYMKGWWENYHQFVAGAVFGVSAILLGSFLRSRRN